MVRSTEENIIMPALIIVGIVLVLALLIWGSLSALKRRRLLEDLPTSKTTGVFIGLVEVKGTAETETPLKSFLAEKNCVWYSWSVQEQWSKTVTETYRDSDGKTKTRTRTESGWTTVASGGESQLFYLKDDLGVVRIDPRQAEIHSSTTLNRNCTSWDSLYYDKGPATAIAHSTGKRSFSEQAILLHQTIYVVGYARERTDCVAAEIAYRSGVPIFMISVHSEESHRSSGLWKFWLLGFLAVAIPVGIGIGIVQEETELAVLIGVPSAMGGTVFAIWGIGWFWMVYNLLIGLKNRVKMAAANIDVELKRRHDLIPQLVRTIEAYLKHEQGVQQATALLRSQTEITSVENAPSAKGCSKHLIGLMERYPDLKADESFVSLHHRLIETEQRIALARNYYNDVIETYNNRRERFPENVIAVLAGLRLVSAFVAEDFERAAVEVRLV